MVAPGIPVAWAGRRSKQHDGRKASHNMINVGQLVRDARPHSAAGYTPERLAFLWEGIGRKVFGLTYRMQPAAGTTLYRAFVRLRVFLTEAAIDPVEYITAIFEHAAKRRARVTPAARTVRADLLWRPWPTAACSAFYQRLYRQWQRERGTRLLADGSQATPLPSRESQRPPTRWQQQALVVAAIRDSWVALSEFPRLYPEQSVRKLLLLEFEQFAAHFLYFYPLAQPLRRAGIGTVAQREIFAQLDQDWILREWCRQQYTHLADVSAVKLPPRVRAR